jgi:hypothetical protein
MDVGGAWETFIAFLREYNVRKIAEVSRAIDWSAWLKQPFFWIGVVVKTFRSANWFPFSEGAW